jgi:hypothetical protein
VYARGKFCKKGEWFSLPMQLDDRSTTAQDAPVHNAGGSGSDGVR